MPSSRQYRALALGIAAALVPAVLVPAAPATAAPAIPGSMVSLGDSITRGFNACGFYVDCPAMSFSTGTYAPVASHYTRILRKNPAIAGKNFNDARSGAKAVDLAGQAATAVGRGVGYVTILIGANDACTSSESTMTPVATFRAQIDAALEKIRTGAPQAAVAVISIPDIHRLWQIGRGDAGALSTWSVLGVCRSMLANPTSTAQADVDRRNRVRQRVVDFNAQLALACAGYGPNCDFDDNAVFGYPFTLSQVSTWDYFHPNSSGQKVLARLSYTAGFNW